MEKSISELNRFINSEKFENLINSDPKFESDDSYLNEIVSDLNTNSIISLSTIFGVANVNLIKEKGIIMTPFNGKKCPRCWNYHKNYHNNENELCVRCITVETNLKG